MCFPALTRLNPVESQPMAFEDSNEVYDRQPIPMLVVLSGPSGVGKDTLLDCLKRTGYDFAFVVTMTTRARRPAERDGIDYNFVDEEGFRDLIRRNELLEYSVVYGDYKGIPKSQVRAALASGKDVLMRIDVQGAAKIRKMVPNVVSIFIAPESDLELVRRLRERKTDSEEALKIRIGTAREELNRYDEFDYLVVNRAGRQDDAVREIVAIITAERCRIQRQPIRL
jgi:guanylate kinase